MLTDRLFTETEVHIESKHTNAGLCCAMATPYKHECYRNGLWTTSEFNIYITFHCMPLFALNNAFMNKYIVNIIVVLLL